MRNIVLVCLDTVRKDYFDEFATRLLDRADLVYDQCRAASSWSAPSHASMFAGTLPHEHGVHAYNRDFSGLSPEDTFFARLPDHRTMGVSANVWAGSSFGFDGLFDEFADVSPDRRFPEGIDVARFGQESEREGIGKQLEFLRQALEHDHPLYSLANGALVQLDDLLARAPVPKPLDDGAKTIFREAKTQVASTSEPFVQFVNVMDAHGPLRHVLGYDASLHDAPNGWTSETVDWSSAVANGDRVAIGRYTGLYGAAIDYLDRKLESYVDEVLSMTDGETTVVVTADHGDNLGSDADEGRWGHTASTLTEGLLHVPLVVLNAPGTGRTHESAYVSHLRLGDLMVGLAEGDRPDVTADHIPAERLGHSGKRHKVADQAAEDNRAVRCVYEGDRKYCWDSGEETSAYRLDPDRACWQERIEAPFNRESLEAALFGTDIDSVAETLGEQSAGGEDVDQVTQDRLRDLGYL